VRPPRSGIGVRVAAAGGRAGVLAGSGVTPGRLSGFGSAGFAGAGSAGLATGASAAGADGGVTTVGSEMTGWMWAGGSSCFGALGRTGGLAVRNVGTALPSGRTIGVTALGAAAGAPGAPWPAVLVRTSHWPRCSGAHHHSAV